MAHFVVTNASVVVNSVDLSDHGIKLDFQPSRDTPEDTAFGSTSKTRLIGLADSQLTLEFNQDFAAGEVDATLWGVHNGAAAVTISWKPVNATTSTSNPQYSGSFILTGINAPLEQGNKATASATFVSTGAVTRATS